MPRGSEVGRLRALAVALFADQKQQSDVNAVGLQFFGRRDLRHDDALGVARAASVDAVGVSDEAMNGGTVSMWVENTSSGRGWPGCVAHTLKRSPSTGMRSTT